MSLLAQAASDNMAAERRHGSRNMGRRVDM
jgi:hypothetical protein